MAVVATLTPENLPERRQAGGIDHVDRLHRHLLETRGRGADADSLALGQREDSTGLIRVDDFRPAVTHLPAAFELLGHDLDATDVAGRIEDLAGVDDRVRHRLE